MGLDLRRAILASKPLRGRFRQQPSDEILAAFRDVWDGREGQFLLYDLLEARVAVLGRKGTDAVDHLVNEDPKRPPIHGAGVSSARDDLWCDVLVRSDERGGSHLWHPDEPELLALPPLPIGGPFQRRRLVLHLVDAHARRLDGPREVKVSELHVSILGQENVFWFEVPVDVPLDVEVLERYGDLSGIHPHLVLLEARQGLPLQYLVHVPELAVLHEESYGALLVECPVQADDERVIRAAKNGVLGHHAPHPVLPREVFLLEDLQGEPRVAHRVTQLHEEHGGARPRPKLLHDREVRHLQGPPVESLRLLEHLPIRVALLVRLRTHGSRPAVALAIIARRQGSRRVVIEVLVRRRLLLTSLSHDE
eukprot:CAMPEP_0197475150 /NCGR_PEP_ID=MMETSP1309-20131121/6584_1 /TAXON_ID=464262 /ORGANISM="Genus nov. species nov., Strain RCC998" /LENGTH=364 /DNA_ID=CAMNT_0043015067 /DNA_START=128 /DNA_END=1222 /DNA_ORIENTATION=-